MSEQETKTENSSQEAKTYSQEQFKGLWADMGAGISSSV